MLALLLLLQACSAVRLAYNQADTILYWRLDSYADLTAEQAPRVRESLAQFLAWHRRSQLPLYAEQLQLIRPRLAEALTPEQACMLFEQLRATVEPPLLDPANWPLLWLPGELSAEQLRHIERKQKITDAEWRQDWLEGTPVQRLDRRFDKALERAEMLYGGLDEPQRAALREGLLQASSFDAQRSYAERLRRQQELRQALRRIHDDRLGAEPARQLLQRYLEHALSPSDPAQQRYTQALIREGCATFARLHNATTPAQRERAMRTLKGYEDDFRALAAQR
ncbi:MAG TPA: DUF6279 family lipoprotein [Roseateles sp.]|nr:DUF6279 family lipoprotein [Roseateles sp.]